MKYTIYIQTEYVKHEKVSSVIIISPWHALLLNCLSLKKGWELESFAANLANEQKVRQSRKNEVLNSIGEFAIRWEFETSLMGD